MIHEILADPHSGQNMGDANCDGVRHGQDDEFVEIVNIGDAPLDLSDATLSDSCCVRHVFAPGTVLAPYEAIVVFGGGQPTFDGSGRHDWCGPLPPTVQVVTASSGSLGLNDSHDRVELRDAADQLLDAYAYGSAVQDASWVRAPELTYGPMVDHSTLAHRRQSPGTLADGSAFDSRAPVDTGNADTGNPAGAGDTDETDPDVP